MDINNELNEFFSYIKQAKQQKKEEIEAQEKEYRDLVGDLSLESVLADYSAHLRGEDPPKRKAKEVQEDKREKQIQEIDSWLTPQVESNDVKDIVNSIISSNKEPVVTENKTNDDVIDHALRILEKVTTKEEVQTNTTSPEISKIRRELENLKNIVAAQGGGGEVRLEFLDDVDRTSAKVDGKFLKYQSSTGKFIGADADATGLTGTPDIVVGIITAAALSVSGNISCAGTITYNDVTNVDSLGIGTFRSGVVVNTGTATTALVVNGDARITGILTIGTSSLTLNGTDDSIQVGTGLTIRDTGDAVYSGVITATTFNGNVTGNVNSSGVSTFSSGLHVTGGSVGIGTNNPQYPLDVAGNIRLGSGSGYALVQYGSSSTSTNNWHVGSEGDGSFRFYNGVLGAGSEKVRIASNGLEVSGADQTTSALDTSNLTVSVKSSTLVPNSGGSLGFGAATKQWAGIKGLVLSGNNNSIGDLSFSTRRVSTDSTLTEAMRITYTGNVGIGTNNPLGKVHVESAATTAGWQIRTDSVGLNNESGFYRDANDDYELVLRNGNGGLSYLKNDGGASSANLIFNVQGSERMRIASNGNVGIGTISPGAPLEINNASPRIRLRDSDGTNTYSEVAAATGALYLSSRNDAANGQFIFQGIGGGTADEHMRIDTSGRLLVGTSSGFQIENTITPRVISANNTGSGNCADLFVGSFQNAGGSGRARVSGKLFLAHSRSGTSGSIGGLVGNNDRLGEVRFVGDDGAQFLTAAEIISEVDGLPGTNDMPGRLIFSTTADGASSPSERLRITSDGHVGIGTNDPKVRLHIQQNAPSIRTTATNADTDEKTWEFQTKSNGEFLIRGANDAQNGFTELFKMVRNGRGLTSSNFIVGNVGIGTNDPQTSLQVNSAAATGIRSHASSAQATDTNKAFKVTNGDNTETFNVSYRGGGFFAGQVFFGTESSSDLNTGAANAKRIDSTSVVMLSSRDSTASRNHHAFYNPNGQVGVIATNGSATVYSTSSDYRLKENVIPIVGAADRVKALKPCRFNFIADASKTVDGFLAHEVQEIVPESVTGTKDETEEIGTLFDWDGSVREENVNEPEILTYKEQVVITPAVEEVEATYDEEGNELTPGVDAVEEVRETVTRTMSWVKTGDRPIMQGIDQAKLVPLLTAALQEAIAKIEILEQRLTDAGL